MEAEDGRVLIGQGPRLTSVDLSTPADPTILDSILLPGMVEDISIDKKWAAVLADGLRIVDADDPEALRQVGQVALSGKRLCVSGDHVFVVGSRPDFQVVSLRRPEQPAVTARFDLPREIDEVVNATDVVVQGEYAYVSFVRRRLTPGSLAESGFVILDVSNPKAVHLIVEYRIIPPIRSLALAGDTLLLASDQRLEIVDIGDTREPKEVGWVEGPRFPVDVCTTDDRAFVITDESAIWAYALDDAGALPEKIVSETAEGKTRRVAILKDLVLVAGGWAGLRVARLDDSPRLREIGSLEAPGEISDIVVSGDFAYVADGRAGMRVFSLVDRDRPEEIMRLPTYDPAVAVDVDRSLVYLAVGDQGLQIYDISMAGAPWLVGSVFTGGRAAAVDGLGYYAFVVNSPGGMLLVRTENPEKAVVDGRFDEVTNPAAVAAAVTRVFVSDQSLNLWVVDVRNPGFPVLEGRTRTTGLVGQIGIHDDHLVLAETDRGLRIIKVSPGGWPQTVAVVNRPGWFQGVVATGNMAFVADMNFGLRVYSILDPLRPSEAGFFAAAGSPSRVAVAHGRIYLAAGEGGLYVLRYSWSPDLTVSGFDFAPQDVVAGTDLSVSGEISNLVSTPTTTGAWVDLVVSGHVDFRPPYRRLSPRLRIDAGFRYPEKIDLAKRRFTVLATVPDGVYTMGIIVDADNEVAEFMEHNNTNWLPRKPLYIGPRPTVAPRWELYR